jgi:hypothetical protein
MRICSCRSAGKLVDDPVDGARRGAGVERAEDEVPRLRRLDGDGHGLEVAHLADEHHVGVLAQRRAQGVLEGVGVDAAPRAG